MRYPIYLFLLAVVILSGCSGTLPLPSQSPLSLSEATLTPFQPLSTATFKPAPTMPSPLRLWIPGDLPEGLRQQIVAVPVEMAASEAEATITLALGRAGEGTPWIYALAAPFPTVRDEVSSQDLLRAWRDEANPLGGPIYVSPSTLEIMQNILGPAGQNVRIEDDTALLEKTWADRPAFAIVPFEALEPRWKVIRVEGQSPVDKHFDPPGLSSHGMVHLARGGDTRCRDRKHAQNRWAEPSFQSRCREIDGYGHDRCYRVGAGHGGEDGGKRDHLPGSGCGRSSPQGRFDAY